MENLRVPGHCFAAATSLLDDIWWELLVWNTGLVSILFQREVLAAHDESPAPHVSRLLVREFEGLLC